MFSLFSCQSLYHVKCCFSKLHWFYLFYIYAYSHDGDAAAKDASSSTSDTDAMEEIREVQSLLASLKEAYEAQSAAMIDLQAQLKMFAENQDANMKWLRVQIEKSAKRQKSVSVADGESDDRLQQQGLDRQAQQEIHPTSREALETASESSLSQSF